MRSAALFAFAFLVASPAAAACPAGPAADTRTARVAGNGWSVSGASTREGSDTLQLTCLSARFSQLPFTMLGYDYRSGRSVYTAALTSLSFGALDWRADAAYTSTTGGADRFAVSQRFRVGDLRLVHRRVLLPRSAARDELQVRTTTGPLALAAAARFGRNFDAAREQRFSARIPLTRELQIGGVLRTGIGAPAARLFVAAKHSSSEFGTFSLRLETGPVASDDAAHAAAGEWTSAMGKGAQISLRAESELAGAYSGTVMLEGRLAF